MHHFLEPLSLREAACLLATLTIGGKAQTPLFAHLPEPSRSRLKNKAQALILLERDKRVPFMVGQLKTLVASTALDELETIDPSWLVHELRGETPRVVAAIMIGLSTPMMRSIVRRMPPAIRAKLPPKSELEALPPELLQTSHRAFANRFHRMPEQSHRGPASPSYSDMIFLDRKVLLKLVRVLGLVELGQAFASVGKMALADFCRRLPRSSAEELVLAVKDSAQLDARTVKGAQRFLSRVVADFRDTEELFHKAGTWRLAKSSLLQPESFRLAFSQRLVREMGLLYRTFSEQAAQMDDLSEEQIRALEHTVTLQVRQAMSAESSAPKQPSSEEPEADADVTMTPMQETQLSAPGAVS